MSAVLFPLRLLIVEDSIASALIMEAQINRREPHFGVRICRTIAGAKEVWATFRPHIVLLDLYLPDSDGEETIAHLKDFSPSCVIAMSGDPSLMIPALKAGAKDFMAKAIGENADPFLKRITDLIPACNACFPS